MAEDGGYHGVTHESDITEDECEPHGPLDRTVPDQIAGQQEAGDGQQQIGEDADEQQGQDVAAVGQLARHR